MKFHSIHIVLLTWCLCFSLPFPERWGLGAPAVCSRYLRWSWVLGGGGESRCVDDTRLSCQNLFCQDTTAAVAGVIWPPVLLMQFMTSLLFATLWGGWGWCYHGGSSYRRCKTTTAEASRIRRKQLTSCTAAFISQFFPLFIYLLYFGQIAFPSFLCTICWDVLLVIFKRRREEKVGAIEGWCCAVLLQLQRNKNKKKSSRDT